MSQPEANPTLIPTPPKRRRWWRWPKRIGLGFFALLFCAVVVYGIVWKVNRYSGQKKLDRVTARLDAEEPGWRFEEIVAEHNLKVPPDESNSSLRVIEIAQEFRSIAETQPFIDLKIDGIINGRDTNMLPTVEHWKNLDEHYAEHRRGIAELRAWNANTPRGRLKMDLGRLNGGDQLYTPRSESTNYRTANLMLIWDTFRAAYRNEPKRALESAAANFHLLRSHDFEPMVLTQFIRFGRPFVIIESIVQTLAWCPKSDGATLAALQELIGIEKSSLSIRATLRAERAYGIRRLETFDRRDTPITDSPLRKADRLFLFHYGQYLPESHTVIHEQFEKLSAIAALPPDRKGAAVREWKKSVSHNDDRLASLAMPPWRNLLVAEMDHEAKCLSAEAGIAAERYRLKHGKWPKSPDDLKAFGIAKWPVDPYDGQPLRFKLLDDGLVIYSVGEDGIDDGGIARTHDNKPQDVAFRLWNVENRRIPAVEKKLDE